MEKKSTYEDLNQKREQHSLAFAQLPDSILITDSDFKITSVNKLFEEMYGYALDDIIGKRPELLNAEPMAENIQQEIYDTVARGDVWKGSALNSRKDDSTFDCEMTISALVDEQGKPFAYIGTQKDITERKQTEESLQKAKNSYQTIVNLTGDIIVQVDVEGHWLFLNDKACSFWGRTREELQFQSFADYLHPDDQEKTTSVIIKMIETGETARNLINRQKTPEGWRVVQWNGSPMFNKGEYVGFQATGRDITKDKQTEDALRESEKKYRLLANNVQDNIWILGLDGKFKYISPSITNMRGYTAEEGMTQSLEEAIAPKYLQTINDLITGELDKLQQGVRPRDQVETTEAKLICKDGSYVPVEIKASFLFDSNQELTGILGVTRDITERKQAEENLLRLQKLESLGVLAGGIAHDFNNLLAGIMGNASIALLDEDNPKKQKELLQKIIKASEKATSLTQQLLTFAKGGIPSTKIASVAEVIEESVNLSLGQSSSVKCELTLPDDLWAIEMDTGQIGQVFQNLIINANQAMPEGGVMQIRAENIEMTSGNPFELNAGDFVHIIFKDNGIGIPEKYLQKIFDPYFSTKDSKKEKGGSGLGLAVSHSVIQKHGGHIYANSIQGKGTTFHIHLPADRDAVLKKTVEESFKATKSLNILVMDDNTMILDLMEKILGSLGHQFVLSEHGAEAVEKYQEAFDEEKFDLVILDLTVPGGMGGVETLEELKKIDPDVKAIISSGYSDQEPNGFAGVLPKPYKIKDLVKVLEEVTMWS